MSTTAEAPTYPVAYSLADLTPQWREIARQVPVGDWLLWDWHMEDSEQRAFLKGREMGSYTSAQQRRPDGVVLLGRRVVGRWR